MISEHVKKLVGTFNGRPWMPVNMCAHCGVDDDPETTSRWPDDDDGDRICRECAENEGL